MENLTREQLLQLAEQQDHRLALQRLASKEYYIKNRERRLDYQRQYYQKLQQAKKIVDLLKTPPT